MLRGLHLNGNLPALIHIHPFKYCTFHHKHTSTHRCYIRANAGIKGTLTHRQEELGIKLATFPLVDIISSESLPLHFLPPRVITESFLPSSIVLGAASPSQASSTAQDYMASITEAECSLRPQLRADFLSHFPGGSRASVNRRMFSERGITLLYIAPSLLPHSLLQLHGLTTRMAADLWTCSPDFFSSD